MNNITFNEEDKPYMKMIYGLAHKYAENPRCSFEDYVNVGLMGLHKARQTYKNNKSTKFSTHAYNVIKNDIMKEWQNNANILSCSPYHIENTENAKEEIEFHNATTISMNAPNKKQPNKTREITPSGFTNYNKTAKAVASGSFSPEETAEKFEIIDKVDSILDSLDEDDRDIIIKRMFEGETFQYIAETKDMSWRTVNYRFHKLMESLKPKFIEVGLDIYATRD